MDNLISSKDNSNIYMGGEINTSIKSTMNFPFQTLKNNSLDKDLYNVNPFQRLFFCEYMNYTKNKFIKNNTMNDLLDYLEFFKNEKNKTEIGFEILKIIYSELLCYIKAYQISREQKIKFMTLYLHPKQRNRYQNQKYPILYLIQNGQMFTLYFLLLQRPFNPLLLKQRNFFIKSQFLSLFK